MYDHVFERVGRDQRRGLAACVDEAAPLFDCGQTPIRITCVAERFTLTDRLQPGGDGEQIQSPAISDPHEIGQQISHGSVPVVHKAVFGIQNLGSRRLFGGRHWQAVRWFCRLPDQVNAAIAYMPLLCQGFPELNSFLAVIKLADVNPVNPAFARGLGGLPKNGLPLFFKGIDVTVGILKILEGGQMDAEVDTPFVRMILYFFERDTDRFY